MIHWEVYWKGPVKENHVEEDCEQGNELEACRFYKVKVCNLLTSFDINFLGLATSEMFYILECFLKGFIFVTKIIVSN